MMQRERQEECERFGLWPLSVVLSDGEWFTLWGDGGTEEDDVVLANGGRLVLYASLDALYAGITVQESNVAGFPIFESFLESLRKGLWPVNYVDCTRPLAAIPGWIRDGPSGWSLGQVEDTLAGLNLVQDAAWSVGNVTVADVIRPEGSLRGFWESLYDVTGLSPPVEWLTDAEKTLRIPTLLARWVDDVVTLAAAVEEAVDSVFTPAVRLGIPAAP